MPYLSAAKALPQHLWATVRLLADRGPMQAELAGKLLSPPALKPDDTTFREAARRLIELGLAREDAGLLALTGKFANLDEFVMVLRGALFAPERNTDLATDPTSGSRDLTVIAAFFLRHDPFGEPVTDTVIYRDIMASRTVGAGTDASNPATNMTRWNDFRHWAPVLGLGTPPLFGDHESSALIPDCTVAVRQVARAIGAADRAVTLPATDLVSAVRREIPVLPGGRYSRELDIPDPGPRVVDPALSFALLRGEHEGWLRLDRHADAPASVTLTDGTTPDRRVTAVTISFGGLS